MVDWVFLSVFNATLYFLFPPSFILSVDILVLCSLFFRGSLYFSLSYDLLFLPFSISFLELGLLAWFGFRVQNAWESFHPTKKSE